MKAAVSLVPVAAIRAADIQQLGAKKRRAISARLFCLSFVDCLVVQNFGLFHSQDFVKFFDEFIRHILKIFHSPVEIILILVIFLIIFGAGRLPQVGEAIGKRLRFLRGGKGKEKD